MDSSIQLEPITSHHSLLTILHWRRAWLLVALAVCGFSFYSAVQAVTPPPDGGYANGNTAEGTNALFNLTTGSKNTADGYLALFFNMSGQLNTAIGSEALYHNSAGSQNTAVGLDALFNNTTGSQNTAVGYLALFRNTHIENQEGDYNTAIGSQALAFNTTGSDNLANGSQALYSNTVGGANTANGYKALAFNATGSFNTANGLRALFSNTTGNLNIAVGAEAGANLTTGSGNIDIGNAGVAGESNTIRIGDQGNQTATFIAGISGTAVTGTAVVVDGNGQLGVATSSARFKDEIRPMDKASEAILALKPVTFRYKPEIDAKGAPQFGLVAEDVAKVNRDLVVRDATGKPYTVRYDAVNAMLLNEFLKEHRKVAQLEATATKQEAMIMQLKCASTSQEATISEFKKAMEVLTAQLQEQATQIQKVSAQLALTEPARKTVATN
jgi:uncharacterized coiled-coil protein SlyX